MKTYSNVFGNTSRSQRQWSSSNNVTPTRRYRYNTRDAWNATGSRQLRIEEQYATAR
jgi:hypothetical protein